MIVGVMELEGEVKWDGDWSIISVILSTVDDDLIVEMELD